MSLMDKIEDMSDADKLFLVGIIAVCVIAFAGIYAWAMHTESQWYRFAEEHNCKQIMEVETITTYRQGMVVGPDGAMHPSLHTTVIPSKRAYTCDDGVTYWR